MKSGLLVYLVTLAPLSAAYVADFNTAGQLAADFSSAQSGPISQSPTGGLNNGGSINLSGLATTTDQIFTLNQSFAGNLASWSASLYYYGNAKNFGGLGMVSQAAPDVVQGTPAQGSAYLPHFYIQSGAASGDNNVTNGALGIGTYTASTETGDFSNLSFVPGGLPASNAWYQYTMDVTYLGLSNYQVEASLFAANADGTLGATLATSSFTFSNPDLAADSEVYVFFNMFDGQAIDNFTFTAVPEPGACLLGALPLLAGAFLRRRR